MPECSEPSHSDEAVWTTFDDEGNDVYACEDHYQWLIDNFTVDALKTVDAEEE